MGALLLFAALAAFMLTARRLDWHASSGHKPAVQPARAAAA
jgi:inner membrane protein involved in colicin E2 resistance